MVSSVHRRDFLKTSLAGMSSSVLLGAEQLRPVGDRRPIVISSANGMKTVEKAMELIRSMRPLPALPSSKPTRMITLWASAAFPTKKGSWNSTPP